MTELYMIYRSPDGTRVLKGEMHINEELQYILNNFGYIKFGKNVDEDEILIFKGEIVTPKPKEIVKEWSF
jgi:hypothetical protein